jgi:hypothetical protein
MTDNDNGGRMAKYRKKPVIVEAIQWTGKNWDEIKEFVRHTKNDTALRMVCSVIGGSALALWIAKSNTSGTVHLDDWIIKERDGVGFYPCTNEQFKETYEPVEEPVEVSADVEEENSPIFDHTGSCERVHSTRTHEEWAKIASSMHKGFGEGRGE